MPLFSAHADLIDGNVSSLTEREFVEKYAQDRLRRDPNEDPSRAVIEALNIRGFVSGGKVVFKAENLASHTVYHELLHFYSGALFRMHVFNVEHLATLQNGDKWDGTSWMNEGLTEWLVRRSGIPEHKEGVHPQYDHAEKLFEKFAPPKGSGYEDAYAKAYFARDFSVLDDYWRSEGRSGFDELIQTWSACVRSGSAACMEWQPSFGARDSRR
jgi:hypothetical protein